MTFARLLIMTVALEVAASAAPAPTAETLYDEGQAAYDRADYSTAIASWQTSYELSGANALLFNIAQAQRLAGDCVAALASYAQFIAADSEPTSAQHQLADEFERELSRTCELPRPQLPVVVAPTARPLDGGRDLNSVGVPPRAGTEVPRMGRTLEIAGLTTSGAGALALTIGFALGHHGQTLGADVTRACEVSCDWSAQAARDAIGRRDVALGYALDGLGATALVGGALLYYIGERRTKIVVSPVASRFGDGAVITYVGSW